MDYHNAQLALLLVVNRAELVWRNCFMCVVLVADSKEMSFAKST